MELTMEARNAYLGTITQPKIDLLRRRLTAKFGQAVAEEAVAQALVTVAECYDPDRGASPNTLFVTYATNAAREIARSDHQRAVVSMDATARNDDDGAHPRTLHDIVPDPNARVDVDSPELNQVPFSIATLRLVERVAEMLTTQQHLVRDNRARYDAKKCKEILAVLVDLIERDVLGDDYGYGNREALYVQIGSRMGLGPKKVKNLFTLLGQTAWLVAPNVMTLRK